MGCDSASGGGRGSSGLTTALGSTGGMADGTSSCRNVHQRWTAGQLSYWIPLDPVESHRIPLDCSDGYCPLTQKRVAHSSTWHLAHEGNDCRTSAYGISEHRATRRRSQAQSRQHTAGHGGPQRPTAGHNGTQRSAQLEVHSEKAQRTAHNPHPT